MSFLLIVFLLVLSLTASYFTGIYLAYIMNPQNRIGNVRNKIEVLFEKFAGKLISEEQNWKQYIMSLLFFNACIFVFAFFILAFQKYLPLNPDNKGNLSWHLMFNTVSSFVTNTNLQHYSGEVSMSYFSQIFSLMWLQFVTPAVGLSALAALSKALSGKTKVGNFYQDMLRAVTCIFIPFALIAGIVLAIAGVPMTFGGAISAATLEGATQTIARGPAAAFTAIKQLGTNGGGFFGPNSTHPFENPTFFSNIIECVCILILPMASVWMFGRITKRMKHAVVVFSVMLLLLLVKVFFAYNFESANTKALEGLPILPGAVNLEGKELRFGGGAGAIWSVATTCSSNGSVNCMHDSLNPLTGLVALSGMWLNSIFGGVGVGFINMFLYIIIGVFIAGLMVGRTPEYLARKVETYEMKLALFALLIHPLLILGGTAVFAITSWGNATVNNPGSHGFTEILYEFTSAAANNGSGFEGLGDNTMPWNIATGIVMLLGRFLPIILPLAICGSLAAKKPTPVTSGTFNTDGILFGVVLLGSIVLIGALLFLPVAVLGPIAEHLHFF